VLTFFWVSSKLHDWVFPEVLPFLGLILIMKAKRASDWNFYLQPL
jgi:hypothetical protein